MGIVIRIFAYIFAFIRSFFLPRIRQPDDIEKVTTEVRSENVFYGDVHQYFSENPENQPDIEKIGGELGQKLRTRNMALIGNHEFRPVPIDLIHEKGDTKEEFGRSGMIQGWILDAAAVFLSIQEIFSAAKREAEKEAQKRTINEIARQNYVAKHGNIVGVVGIAGIGKTTLGHQHLELVTQEYENIPNAIVFHVSLRDFDYKVKINVLQFLLMSSIPDWKHDLITDKALLENIAASQNVHIVMDALDEAKMDDLSFNAPAMNLYDTATPDVIFKNLSSGHLLPNARKMVISRPKAFDQLAEKSKPLFVVKALGLGEESQQLLFKRMCPNQADFEEINRQLSLNPVIKALCFIPVFLKLFAPYALKHRNGGGVYSMADIFSSFLEDCVESNLFKADPSELFKLFELAFAGVFNQKYLFDKVDLSKHDIQSNLVDLFLNLQVTENESRVRIWAGRKRYFFSHLNWQEFFAGLRLMYRSNLTNISDDLKKRLKSDRWEVVMRFLFGLTNPKVHEKIVGIFPTLAGQEAHYQSQVLALQDICAEMAHEHSRSLKDFTIPLFNLTDYNCRIQRTAILNQPSDTRLLKLCSFAFESKDPVITQSIVDTIPDEIVLRKTILPSDVIYLCHILQKTAKQVTIFVGHYRQPVTFIGHGLKMFLESVKGKIFNFHISNAKLDEGDLENLARHIPNMIELSFESCNLTSHMVRIITDALITRPTPISLLDISGNEINEGFLYFTKCMKNITRLTIRKMQMSTEGLCHLTSSISARREPLKWLGMGEDHFGPTELRYLASCIHHIEIISTDFCKINGRDLKPLTDAIKLSSKKLKWLNIAGNNLGQEGLEYIADCVENVEVLIITDCKFVGTDLVKFTENIATLQNPMDWLVLSENDLHDNGARLLSNCIPNIKSLSMRSCNLADSSVKFLCHAVSQRRVPMALLELSSNPLGDETAQNLAFCLPHITRLLVYGCNFTETGRQFILSSLAVHNNCCLVEGLDDQNDPTLRHLPTEENRKTTKDIFKTSDSISNAPTNAAQ